MRNIYRKIISAGQDKAKTNQVQLIEKINDLSFKVTDETKTYEVLEKLLQFAFRRAQAQGMGFLQYDPKDTVSLKDILRREFDPKEGEFYLDYLNGRVMKMDFTWKDNIITITDRLYDRDNGEGAAKEVVAKVIIHFNDNAEDIAAEQQKTQSERNAHLQWCKDRAMEYVEKGQLKEAYASFVADMLKHPDTADHPAIKLGLMLLISGNLSSQAAMQKFIEGFN